MNLADEINNLNNNDRELFEEFIRDPASLDISQLAPKRPTVGNDMPVVLWRLVRVVGMHQILGEDAPETTYFVGKNIGKMLMAKSIEDLHKKLTDLKIGKLNFPVNTSESVHMSIDECVTCAGITPPLGRAICQLETGIVAGALETIYPGKKATGEETKCIGGLGDGFCLVECRII
jgi:hypothetical protein